MTELMACPVCKENATITYKNPFQTELFVSCMCCGYYYIADRYGDIPNDEIAAYLFYYRLEHLDKKGHGCVVFSKTLYEKMKEENPKLHYLDRDEVLNWYPKTFSEKIDMILLGCDKLQEYSGSTLRLKRAEKISMFFVKRFDPKGKKYEESDLNSQYMYVYSYMEGMKYIEDCGSGYFRMLPDGLNRIDILQKTQKNNNTVFAAMSFAPDMQQIREAIRTAILEVNFIPRIMDEIEHNHQIVPEMLHEIRASKFVIAELTNHNNGAYFEAGYALGFGKEVILVCNKDAFFREGHFDIKQINTVLWDTPGDLKDKLIKRIRATIA